MYGGGSAGGGAGLAATGMAAGSWVLAAIGAVFFAVGLLVLLKKNSKHRP